MMLKMKDNNWKPGIRRIFLACMIFFITKPAFSDSLVKKYVIYYGTNSTKTEKAVCQDLKEDIEQVTGATVIIAAESSGIKGADYYYLVGTAKTSSQVARLVRNNVIRLDRANQQGGIIRLIKENGAAFVLLAGTTVEGEQNTVYEYSRSALKVDPLNYWTGYHPEKNENFNPYEIQNRTIASPVVPIICYMENDVDELANLHKPYLEYDMETWKGMVNSLRRMRYNAIQLFDMLGRPEFFTREPYKKLRPDYRANLPLVDSMIQYAHLKGMKIQVDLSLGYQVRSISDSEALCWSQYKDKWIETWIYYLTKTPLGKADIYSLRPRNQVWDRAYVSSCGENKVKVFNEVFAAFDSVLNAYKPGVAKVAICYDDGMEMFNNGFNPPKDFIIAWSDDGYCNFKEMPHSTKGYAFGTYMHAGYWKNHTVHDPYPVRIDSVMSAMLKDYDAGSYLEVNGQTFRPFLLNLQAFSGWAYAPDHFDGDMFYRNWTSAYFGPKASSFAIASMKALHHAQFNRTGYVQHLAEIRKIIGFLQDRDVVTPRGSFSVSYENVPVDGLQKRSDYINLAFKHALSGLSVAQDQVGFYYDYIYLPALMYKQLLELENTLLPAAFYKNAYTTEHQKKDIHETEKLIKEAYHQLEQINKTCLEGDKNPKWETWYDPQKRRPNNGFPTLEMIKLIQQNLARL